MSRRFRAEDLVVRDPAARPDFGRCLFHVLSHYAPERCGLTEDSTARGTAIVLAAELGLGRRAVEHWAFGTQPTRMAACLTAMRKAAARGWPPMVLEIPTHGPAGIRVQPWDRSPRFVSVEEG